MAGVAGLGVIFAAYYMLPMVQRIFFNRLEKDENRALPDLSRRELAILVPMIALMIWLGVNPAPVMRKMEPSVELLVTYVTRGDVAPTPAVDLGD